MGTACRVNTAEVGTLVQVAVVTRPGKIRFGGWAAVLPGNDVFAMESKEGILVLMRPAVFAAVARSAANEIAKNGVHSDWLCGWRVR